MMLWESSWVTDVHLAFWYIITRPFDILSPETKCLNDLVNDPMSIIFYFLLLTNKLGCSSDCDLVKVSSYNLIKPNLSVSLTILGFIFMF